MPRAAGDCVTGISSCCSPSRGGATRMRGTLYPRRPPIHVHDGLHHQTLRSLFHSALPFASQTRDLVEVSCFRKDIADGNKDGDRQGILSKIRFRYTSCTASMTSFLVQSSLSKNHEPTSRLAGSTAKTLVQHPRALVLVLFCHNLRRSSSRTTLCQPQFFACKCAVLRLHHGSIPPWLEQCQRVSLIRQRALFTIYQSPQLASVE